MKHLLLSSLVLWVLTASACFADEKADRLAVAQNNNQFAVELYGKLCAQDGNLFFSPYNIETALGMTYAGADGETAAQMAKPTGISAPAAVTLCAVMRSTAVAVRSVTPSAASLRSA